PSEVRGPFQSPKESDSHLPRSEPRSHHPSEPSSRLPRSEAPSTSPREPSSHLLRSEPHPQNPSEPGSSPPRPEVPSTQPQGAWLPPSKLSRPIHTAIASMTPVPEVRGPVHTAPASKTPTPPLHPRGQRFRHHSHSECGSHFPKSEAPSTQPQQGWFLPTEVISAIHTDPPQEARLLSPNDRNPVHTAPASPAPTLRGL
ncbi:unnamed protein product, partial [Gulo gulo]